MSRKSRHSHPTSSKYSNSPNRPRETRASSIFPYSTERPPTNYSQQSWVPQNAPPVPRSRPNVNENPFGGIEEEVEEEMEPRGETPLYQRPDWDGNDDGESDEASTATGSAWSRSSFAGMTTAAPTPGVGGLEGIEEEEEMTPVRRDVPPRAASIVQGRPSSAVQRTPAFEPKKKRDSKSSKRPRSSSTSMRQRFEKHTSQSTIPSVLDLADLTERNLPPDGTIDPDRTTSARRRSSYLPEPTPDLNRGKPPSPDLMTPTAHQRLGRMSVAPVRYTLPARRAGSATPIGRRSPRSNASISVWGTVRRYSAEYGVFLDPALTVTCAILLTMTLQVSSGVSIFVEIPGGAFKVDAASGKEAGLGVKGWCQRGGDTSCKAYSDGDFANENASVTIPGSSVEPGRLAYADADQLQNHAECPGECSARTDMLHLAPCSFPTRHRRPSLLPLLRTLFAVLTPDASASPSLHECGTR